jgi:hypothetical protein
VFIADTANNVVEKVTPAGQLSIVAGIPGKSGVPTPGPATTSDLNGPLGLALDSSGDLFIADSKNAVVEEVTPSGQLSIVAGQPGHSGLPIPGAATSSYLNSPDAVVVDSANNDLYIADTSNDVIEEVTPAGQLSVVGGIADGFDDPEGLTVDPTTGNVYIADTFDDVVWQLTPAGKLAVVAGRLALSGPPPVGAATSSRLTSPKGLAYDTTSGTLFIADSGNDDVEQVLEPTPVPPPAVTGVTPDSGPIAGGTTITITGTGFAPGASVTITQGGAQSTAIDATDVTVLSSRKLTAVTGGAAKAGTWDVLVAEPSGTSAASRRDRYRYVPTVSSVSPHRGPTAGGTHIRVTGTGFVNGAKVVIRRHGTNKAIRAAHVKVVSPTEITAITGGHAKPGTWSVYVIERGVTSAAGRGDHYRYTS